MAAARRDAVFGKASLPHTIVLARGERIRHWTVRPWVLVGGVCVCGLAGVALLGSTALFLMSDRVADALRSREAANVSAYERRISDLRDELDRAATRQHAERDALSREINELLTQQRELKSRFEQLAPLLRKASDAGLLPAGAADALEERAEALPAAMSGDDPVLLAGNVLPALRRSVDAIGEEQSTRIGALAGEAQTMARRMAELLDRFGVEAPSQDRELAVGGPFVEGTDGFAESLDQLEQALDLIGHLRRRSEGLPLGVPIASGTQSSSFGFRTDPFLGRRALHTGVDFAAPRGTIVEAGAAGRVVHAGDAGGYGLMVEIDHGDGISTRYGHLSRIDVEEGQVVSAGERLGAVGSTGRSTGPHLHYEVRKNDHPVNPQRYLDAGRRLAALR